MNFLDTWIDNCYGVAEKAHLDLRGFRGALFAEEWRSLSEKMRLPAMKSSFQSYRSDLKKMLSEKNGQAARKLWETFAED